MPIISAVWETEAGEWWVWGQPEQHKWNPVSKNKALKYSVYLNIRNFKEHISEQANKSNTQMPEEKKKIAFGEIWKQSGKQRLFLLLAVVPCTFASVNMDFVALSVSLF